MKFWLLAPVRIDVAKLRTHLLASAVAGCLVNAPLNDPAFNIFLAQANASNLDYALRVEMLPAPADMQTVLVNGNNILPLWRPDVLPRLKQHLTDWAAFAAANGVLGRCVEIVISPQGCYDYDDEDGLQLAANYSTSELLAANFNAPAYIAAHADFVAWLSAQPWAQGMAISWRPFTSGHEPRFDPVTGQQTNNPPPHALANATMDAIKTNYTAGQVKFGMTTWDGTPLNAWQQQAADYLDAWIAQAKTGLTQPVFGTAWAAAAAAGAERFEGHPGQELWVPAGSN